MTGKDIVPADQITVHEGDQFEVYRFNMTNADPRYGSQGREVTIGTFIGEDGKRQALNLAGELNRFVEKATLVGIMFTAAYEFRIEQVRRAKDGTVVRRTLSYTVEDQNRDVWGDEPSIIGDVEKLNEALRTINQITGRGTGNGADDQ